MLMQFASVFVFALVALGFVGVSVILSRLIHPRHKTAEKLVNYECGEDPVGSPWVQFNIRFYMVALAFIVFDVETIFLFPWAVVFNKLGLFAFVEMLIFIGILLIGLAYLWAKGDLEWVKPKPRYGPSSVEQAP